jgi:hypothetical protein
VLVESLGPDFHRDDEKMKCLPGWPSNLWICKELWREMKLKKMCAYESDESRDPGFPHVHWLQVWVPAFAGMTEVGVLATDVKKV